MKRALAVVLCLLIVVSSFATVLFTGASANTEGSVFDNPNNWQRYAFDSTHINSESGTVPSWGSVKTNTNTAYTYGGDATSIEIAAKLQLSTIEFETEPNTNYTLTYRFFTTGAKYDSDNYVNDTYLVRTGIVTSNGCVTWGQDGYILFLGPDNAYDAPNGVFANRTSLATRTADWSEESKWHQVTLKFNSGNNSKLKLVVQAGTDSFYLDDFFLAEKHDFESLANWGIYNPDTAEANYVPTATYGDNPGQLKMSWNNISTVATQDADSTGKSVKINGNAINVAANLPTLRANTKYTLSFKYKPDTNTVVAGSTGAYFTSHIIKKGTDFAADKAGPAEFVANVGKGTETSDWKQISVDFKTDASSDYMLEFRFAFAAGHILFLDAFEITEKESATYFIQDFEDYTKSNNEYVGAALSIVTPEGTSVSGTKALFYDSSVSGAITSEGNNRVILNPSNSGLPTLDEIASKGNKFRVTFKYKLLEGEVKFYMNASTDGTSAWNLAATNPILYKSSNLSAGNTWQEFSYDFTLKADADDAAKYPVFLIGGVGKAYIDYVTVSTLAANVPDVEIPDENPDEPEDTTIDPAYFETISNWYSVNGASSSSGGKNLPGYTNGNDLAPSTAWYNIKVNTNKSYINDGDKSIKIYGNATFHYFMLPNLKANNKYTLTLKYYADYVNANGNKIFSRLGIYNPNAEGAILNGPTGDVVMAPSTATAKTWNDVTLEFSTNENTDLAFLANIGLGPKPSDVTGNQYTAFLDAFTLTDNGPVTTPEPEPDPEPKPDPEPPVDPEKVPQEKVVIDFDTIGANATVSPNDRIEIVEAEGYDGNTSKMLHFKKGQYASATVLNYHTGYEKDNDDTFTVAVKPNTEYTFSFRIKANSQVLPEGAKAEWIGVYATYKKSNIVSTYHHGEARDKWRYCEKTFTTAADQNLITFYVNAGESTPDVWIDDVTFAEKKETIDPNIVGDEYFEVATNWNAVSGVSGNINLPGYTNGGELAASNVWYKITENTNTAHINDGTKSLKVTGNANYLYTMLPNLKANNKYTLTLKYYADYVNSNESKVFGNLGVYNPNASGATIGGTVGYVALAPKSATAKTWNEVTLEFTTDTNTDLALLLNIALGLKPADVTGEQFVSYVDAIKLTDNGEATTPEPEPEPEPEPDPTPNPNPNPDSVDPADYDNAANWKLYNADYAPIINGEGILESGWTNNTQNTNKKYTYNNGEKSIKFYGNIQYIAIKLANLEEGKAYKVKFMYYAPTSSVVGATSKAWTNGVGIVKGGTAMNGNTPTEYFKKGAVFAGQAGEWHEYSINFRAVTTDMYFGMGLTFASGFELYVDDFTVAETDEDPDAPPVVPGKEPKDEVVIDFDNYGSDATLSPKERMEIVTAEAYDGKPSKMLHFKKGYYSDIATTLNYSSTYSTDTDAVFTIGVKPKRVYTLSFRVKTNSQTLPAGEKEWIGIYATFGKKYLVSSYQHNAKRDEWLYYTYSVNTSADQNLLSFFVNAGNYTPDMWIDDIKITETDYEPFLGWGDEPLEDLVINFDDFYVSYDIPCASIVDGPARDGKVSKATYLKGGDYDYNVVANYSTVTKYTDAVFTVPCKENTLYEFSYYIYVPKDTGKVGYFAVYYDWANTWVLRASGMPERDKWVKKSVRFTTKSGQTKLSLTFNGGKTIPDIYLDDIRLQELKPGVIKYANEESYCEDCFNILADNGEIEQITKAKSTVIKVPVLKQQQYIFGITVNSLKKSNSRIFLSLDGVNPMPQSDPTAPSAIISADGSLGRYGINFISDASGYVYIVIENDDGALTLKDPYMFIALSLSTSLPMGREEKQVVGILSVNINKGELKKLFVFDDEEEGEQE